ncbi:MAG: clostripain-related cysteine peptidase [Terrisporobacter sp.]
MKDNYYGPIYKPWTVLIYANGNNDLEPEISKSLLDIERIGAGTNTNVIVQLARAPYKLIKSIRPNLLNLTDIDGDWSGVRRYLVKENSNISQKRDFNSVLLDDLGNVNMADPTTLKDFISWGFNNFTSKHLMLILVGHGAGFMGILPDYTLRYPQIMSINGLNIAINKASEETGKKIDILLLDSCYMNMVEIIYELGVDLKSSSYLITPQVSPIEGLPYETIMKVLKGINKSDNTSTLIKKLVPQVNNILNKKGISLTVFHLNSFLLRCTKIIISNISTWAIKNKIDFKKYATRSHDGFPTIEFCYLLNILKNTTNNFKMLINIFIFTICIKFINTKFNIGESRVVNNSGLYIFAPDNDYFKVMVNYYSKMRFTHNNKWIIYLSEKKGNYKVNKIFFKYTLPLSDDMPLEGILNVIKSHNPWLNQDDLNNIIDDLGWSCCVRLNDLK